MLYVLVVLLVSGDAVVIDRSDLTEQSCRAAAEELVESGRAAIAQCFERVDA